jgi:hypothetical protein
MATIVRFLLLLTALMLVSSCRRAEVPGSSGFVSPAAALPRITSGRTKRISTWDRTGQNQDNRRIGPGERAVLADIKGPGSINHILVLLVYPDLLDYRDVVLRMFWDGEKTPSVEAPLGDFFCVGHCTVRRFNSLMMAINPGMDAETINNGMNCYFPMPFASGARIELENQSSRTLGGAWGRIWYHIDYEEFDTPPSDDHLGRFHAQWRRTVFKDARGKPRQGLGAFPGLNTTGKDNYALLEAEGEGQVVGMFLEVDNLQGGWWGEGDDMVFIDGEGWPPSLHGTGTEEIFGGGACPHTEYAGLYTGFVLIENLGGQRFRGKNAMYRWFAHDPIRFRKSIRMTVEHGHDNDYENDYSSVVYWYQREPHATFPALPPREQRLPNFPEVFWRAEAKFSKLNEATVPVLDRFAYEGVALPPWVGPVRDRTLRGYTLFYTRDYEKADRLLGEALSIMESAGRSAR